MDRRRKLLNSSEAATRRILQASADRNAAEVWPKVRIADVLDLNRSGLTNELFRYGLQAHFDFVVVGDGDMPLFAVEFDGPGHEAPAAASNDLKKNAICQAMTFPLARVRDEHLFQKARGIDYVTWLTEVYFTYQWLGAAQDAGQIPGDEPLDPMLVMSLPNLRPQFPLWLSAGARVRLQAKHRAGLIWHPVPFCLVGEDASGTSSCMAILVRTEGKFLTSTGSIYMRRFGVSGLEASEEIAVVNIERMVEVDHRVIDTHELRATLLDFIRRHPESSCHGPMGIPLGFSIGFQAKSGFRTWRVGGLGSLQEETIEVT